MDTAHRLGKRLIEMDKKAEELEKTKRNKLRQRSLTQVESSKIEDVTRSPK